MLDASVIVIHSGSERIGGSPMSVPEIKSCWSSNFSQRVGRSRIRNSSELHSADRDERRMVENQKVNREAMDETFECLESDCREGS